MAGEIETSTTVGVTGQTWRASVSSWGSVTPWTDTDTDTDTPDAVTAETVTAETVTGETVTAERDAPATPHPATLDWFIAADDRWHSPATEAAVRQRRIDGTPVVETRVRIPDGDAVQRVWSVASAGGLTIVEVENDSPLPFAVAFSGIPVVTERPAVDVPIQGIELPAGAITLPVGHHASIRIAIVHSSGVTLDGAHLRSLPDAAAVARGWVSIAERSSRLDLPDDGLSDAVIAARCDLMLEGPIDPDVDPIGFVLDVGELVRSGDDAAAWLPELVDPLEAVAKSDDPMLPAALVAAHRVALGAGDRRAAGDIERLRARVASRVTQPALGPFSDLRRSGSVGRFVHDVERRLANGGDLLPTGIPTRWMGANFELHDVPTSEQSTVSFAVRWHGERPAVLWEQSGPPQLLTASAVDAEWTSADPAGEGLWAAPPTPAATAKLSVVTESADASQNSTSFS